MDDNFDLVQHAKVAARNAIDRLEEPDADILPVVLSYGRRGVSIMGAVMPGTEQGKDDLADAITARIAVAQATEAVMVCTAYLSHLDPATGKTSERQETVVLFHCAEKCQQAWTAKITRHTNRPPDMSIWEELGEGTVAGRFAEAMATGLAFGKAVDADMQQVLDEGYEDGRVEELVKMFLSAKAALAMFGAVLP